MTRPPPEAPTLSRRSLVAGALASIPALALARLARADSPRPYDFAEADRAIEGAIADQLIPGAVLCAGTTAGVAYTKAYGNRAVAPAKVAMTEDTVFDLASLSKPIGCATSVMLLLQQGKLAVTDKAAKHLPDFAANGKQDVTVEHLLLHRGGVIADNSLKDYSGSRAEIVKRTLQTQLNYPPGSKMIYSDVGFMTLGEIVGVVSGRPLNAFAAEEVFKPLGLNDTTYLPGDDLKKRCAPTEQRDGKWMVGEVHDPRAYALGGFAGHAGLFGTARDVATYCRMLLGGGEVDGKRVLSAETVAQMTKPRPYPDGQDVRAYGFDVDSKYSAPRGERFTKGVSFGHTGFTGTSLWIDPANRAFVVLLTNAVHPKHKGKPINALRSAVGTAVASTMIPNVTKQPSPAGGQ